MRFATRNWVRSLGVVAALVAASAANAQLAPDWMVPAVAHADGQAGTYWLTDLSLHNPHDVTLPVVIQLLESNVENDTAPALELDLYPFETLNLWDVLGPDIFDFYGTGAMLVYADTNLQCAGDDCNFLVMSRTFTLEPNGGAGEYGQTIPGLSIDQGLDWWTFAYAAGLLNDGVDFRCNFGVASWTPEWTVIRVDVQDSDGSILATEEIEIPPFGHVQHRLATPVTGGSLVFYLVEGPDDALVFPYASIVNQVTGDPSFVVTKISEIGVETQAAAAAPRRDTRRAVPGITHAERFAASQRQSMTLR